MLKAHRVSRCLTHNLSVGALWGLVVAAVVAAPPHPARAWFFYGMGGADSALGGNTIVDIRYDGHSLWLATGKGLTRATPAGVEAEFANFGDDKLNSAEISAVAPRDGEIWVAPSFSEVRSNQLVPYGAGFNFTADSGVTWDSASPTQASGPGKICYDIAFLERDSSIWAACFYGGLIRSQDHGLTWDNVFPSQSSASDFINEKYLALENRFFSVITDETGADSALVWAGSAGGIHEFVFLDPTLKLSGTYGQALLQNGDTVWLATEAGLSFTLDAGRTWRTFAENSGFPTSFVASVFSGPDGIWAGVGSFVDTVGAGIMHSSDGGRSWQLFEPPQAVGARQLVTDFTQVNGTTYAACGEGGLIHTADHGSTWSSDVPVNATADAYYSLAAQVRNTDTTILWAGTDDYLYEFVFTDLPTPDTLIKHGFDVDTISVSNRVKVVEIQPLRSGEKVIWTLHQATGPTRLDGFATSADGGQTWLMTPGSAKPFAVGFSDSLFYLGTDNGVVRNAYGSSPANAVWLAALDTVLGGINSVTDVRSILVSGNSVWVGSDVGIAISADSGNTWLKVVSNSDPGVPDDTLHYKFCAGDTCISGNFITALGLSRYAGTKRIWAATQQTSSSQTNGVCVTTDNGKNWQVVLSSVLAWNFAFDGPKVYVATSDGLLISPDNGQNWDTVDVFIDDARGHEISKGTEVFAVCAVHDTVWVGTENGLAISYDGGSHWRVLRRFEWIDGATESDRYDWPMTEAEGSEPYATPVPWSRAQHITPGPIRFHFVPPVDGPVRITVYDFANQKVIELADGISRQARAQYDETHVWNGKNGDGDDLAVGTYFFVVEYGDGSRQAGKLVILP